MKIKNINLLKLMILEQIAGIPEDKTLLDPDKTTETNSNGQQLLD